MPVLTRPRLPLEALPDAELPDPRQRVLLLRQALRCSGTFAAIVCAAGTLAAAGALSVGGLSLADRHDWTPVIIALAVVALLNWIGLRRDLRAAEDLASPVTLGEVAVWAAVRRFAPRLAVEAAGAAALLGGLSALAGDGEAVAFGALLTGAALLRILLVEAGVALRERRQDHRYLVRAELPHDGLLYVSPEELDALRPA